MKSKIYNIADEEEESEFAMSHMNDEYYSSSVEVEAQRLRTRNGGYWSENWIPYNAKKAIAMCDKKKADCKKKKRDFDLTYGWYRKKLDHGKCEVSGIPLKLSQGGKGRGPAIYSATVDRIDPTKGYTQDNCRMVIMGVNGCKHTGSDADMLNVAYSIIKKYGV